MTPQEQLTVLQEALHFFAYVAFIVAMVPYALGVFGDFFKG